MDLQKFQDYLQMNFLRHGKKIRIKQYNFLKDAENVNSTSKDLGITELRERDTVLRLANGNKQLADARTNADKGFKEGIALNKEAETKYKTLGNQMKIFMNNVRDLGISIGGALAPLIKFISIYTSFSSA